jgi:hypothetical protein
MPDKTQAEIPYSLLEYTPEFKRPILEALSPPAKIVGAILDALSPWGYRPDGVEFITQVRKLDEYTIVFRRTAPAAPTRSLTLRAANLSVVAENLDWTQAEQFIAEQTAALNAIRGVGGAEIQSQQLVLAMHIQLKERPRKEVTAPLLTPVGHQLLGGTPDFSGVILLRDKAAVIIDASLAYANGLFVRVARTHPPEASLQELAETLRRDEQCIFDTLGLEGDL